MLIGKSNQRSTRMKACSHRLITSVARAIVVICAAVLFTRAHTAQAESTESESPAERAWWAFQQRAYPLGHIPADAQMRALRQVHEARAARSSTAGGGAAGESDRWVNIGPAPILNNRPMSGRVTTIAVDPRDLQHWLIGAAQGGIWETRDAGTTWIPKTDAAASLAMGKIAFAPGDPAIVYAGTGEAVDGSNGYGGAGLLKSTDSGATWQLLATSTFSGASFGALQVDPNDARIVMAATRAGAFGRRSADQVPFPPQTGIFKSADGGVTWSNKLIGRASSLAVDRRKFQSPVRRHRGLPMRRRANDPVRRGRSAPTPYATACTDQRTLETAGPCWAVPGIPSRAASAAWSWHWLLQIPTFST